MATLKQLIECEISDFFAGFGHPGEPETPEEMQSQLLERVMPLLAGLEQEPVYQVLGDGSWTDYSKQQLEDLLESKPSTLFRVAYAAPQLPQPAVVDEHGLLPCPFCGGKPEEDAGGCSEYDGHEHQDYSISCKTCGAEVYCAVGSFEKADVPCSCHHNTRSVCVDKWNRRAAMLQGAESVQAWIPCSERMPEFYFSVLATDEHEDMVIALPVYLDAGDRCAFQLSNGDIFIATHWMPLPAAPQQEVK